jgi:hypothetical protein
VEEEGEVFRKGTVLLGPEEMEGEYPGEELRKEVCIQLFSPKLSSDTNFFLAPGSHGGEATTTPTN